MGKFAEYLVNEKVISEEQYNNAQEFEKKYGLSISIFLLKSGFLSESKLSNYLSKFYNIPSIDLNKVDISEDVIKLIPADIAKKFCCVPVSLDDKILNVAMLDPSDFLAIDDISFITGKKINVLIATETNIYRALIKYYGIHKSEPLGQLIEKINTVKINGSNFEEITKEEKKEEIKSESIKEETEVPIDKESGESSEKDKETTAEEESYEDNITKKIFNTILIDSYERNVKDLIIELHDKFVKVFYSFADTNEDVYLLPSFMKNAFMNQIKDIVYSSNKLLKLKVNTYDCKIKLKNKLIYYTVTTKKEIFGERIIISYNKTENFEEISKSEEEIYYKEFLDEDIYSSLTNGYYYMSTIIENLIIDALQRKATEIYFKPYKYSVDIYLNIDGKINEMYIFPKELYPDINKRLKIMLNMDIIETKVTQNGKMKYKNKDKIEKILAECNPTSFGENFKLEIVKF